MKKYEIGQKVHTAFGDGFILGIDLPDSRGVSRWIIQITDPIESHSLIEEGKPMCFFDHEVTRY